MGPRRRRCDSCRFDHFSRPPSRLTRRTPKPYPWFRDGRRGLPFSASGGISIHASLRNSWATPVRVRFPPRRPIFRAVMAEILRSKSIPAPRMQTSAAINERRLAAKAARRKGSRGASPVFSRKTSSEAVSARLLLMAETDRRRDPRIRGVQTPESRTRRSPPISLWRVVSLRILRLLWSPVRIRPRPSLGA